MAKLKNEKEIIRIEDAKRDSAFVVELLKACAKKKDVSRGIQLHADALRRGLLQKNFYVSSAVISMYAKCGGLREAQDLFDELPVRNSVCWNAMISGYAQQGQGKEAVYCFKRHKIGK